MRTLFLLFLALCFLVAAALAPGFASAEDLRITWTYEAGLDNVSGFKLYASTTSGQYTDEDLVATVDYNTGATQYEALRTIAGTPGQVTTFYFVATTFNQTHESSHSEELAYDLLGPPKDIQFNVVVPTGTQ
jgi:hypothetical protein